MHVLRFKECLLLSLSYTFHYCFSLASYYTLVCVCVHLFVSQINMLNMFSVFTSCVCVSPPVYLWDHQNQPDKPTSHLHKMKSCAWYVDKQCKMRKYHKKMEGLKMKLSQEQWQYSLPNQLTYSQSESVIQFGQMHYFKSETSIRL